MTYDEQGRFWRALCISWQTGTPGLASEEQWRGWCAYTEGEWPDHRDAIGAAFRILANGQWLQKRTVETRKGQVQRQKQARMGAAATNEKRWGSVARRQDRRSHSDTSGGRCAVSPSSSSSSSRKEKPFHPSGADPPQGEGPPPETVISIPTNTGDGFPISLDQVSEWSVLFPAVDVVQTLNEIRAWNLANASRRKTRSGVLRHVTGWLAREQNRPGPHPAAAPVAAVPVGADVLTQINADRQRYLDEHDPEAAAQAREAVARLVGDTAKVLTMGAKTR
jgi:uncharacterized protein YdaU (DUF1376 family)